MDPNETMVEEQGAESVADDTLHEDLAEEQDASESLESVMTEESPSEEPQPQGTSEPGWIKKRIEKAVSKAVAETRAQMQELLDAQLAPYKERLIEQEANELVRQGEFKSLDRAKEYLQLKQGITPAADSTPPEQPRNERGQFAPKQSGSDARAEILARQAQKIKTNRGLDVMAEYKNNEETREKILSGEWDFYDVADELAQRKAAKPKSPSSPMRSPNGASGSEKSSIASMSDEQFKRLVGKLSEGARFDIS